MEEKDKDIEKAIREFYEGKDNPEGKRIFDKVFENIITDNDRVNQLDGLDEGFWKKSIQVGIGEKLEIKHITKSKTHFNNIKLKYIAGMVASVILLIFCGIFFYTDKQYNQENEIEFVTTLSRQKGNVSLTDGTKIVLNVKSSIAFPKKFNGDERRIELKGEAFFNVARDTLKPFIVQTDGMEVEVLGTSFNIKSYEEDQEILVTVATGKVAVTFQESPQNPELLLPEDQVRYYKNNGSWQLEKTDPEQSILWKEGILLFENETIDAITKTLERNYNISITIQDEKLKEKRITFKQKGENLANILDAISHLAEMQYRLEDNNVVFFNN